MHVWFLKVPGTHVVALLPTTVAFFTVAFFTFTPFTLPRSIIEEMSSNLVMQLHICKGLRSSTSGMSCTTGQKTLSRAALTYTGS